MSGSSDYTTTPNLGLYKPIFNMAVGTWGDLWNSNADKLDTISSGGSVANVTEHGAAGDGTTDDTAAIQAALNTYAGKAVVFIPDTGHAYIVGLLTLPSHTDLLLHGTLNLKAGVYGGVGMLAVTNAYNVTIRGNGTIDASKATAQAAGLNISGSTNVRVSGITIQDAYYWNLNVGNSTNVRIDGASLVGGNAANEFAAASDNCWLLGCYINGPAQDEGFSFYGGVTNSGAIGNTIKNTGAAAISVLNDGPQPAPCSEITIADNICFNCQYGGIAVDRGVGGTGAHSGIVITGNRTYNNNLSNGAQGSEISADYIGSVVISGNMVSDTSAYNTTDATFPCAMGIHMGGNCTNATITGNSVWNIGNSARAGFGLYISSTNVANVSGNTFHDYRSPQYMTGIGGAAGLKNSFIANLFGNLVANYNFVSLQPDTAIFNPSTLGLSFGQAVPANAANDAAAATAGVPVGGMYRNGSVLMVRVA